jgi:hypothetical protein
MNFFTECPLHKSVCILGRMIVIDQLGGQAFPAASVAEGPHIAGSPGTAIGGVALFLGFEGGRGGGGLRDGLAVGFLVVEVIAEGSDPRLCVGDTDHL